METSPLLQKFLGVQPRAFGLVLAGIVAIIADRFPNIGWVKACLIFHITAAVAAAVINFLYVRDILYFFPTFCTFTDRVQHGCRVLTRFVFYCTALRGIAFAAGTVGFCLAISIAAFGCQTVCYPSSENTATVVNLRLQEGKIDPE
ncbi:uncharacterized protein LOC121919874 isoform X2 [Sceloporus undulatus]|uniref:uncharacterized protein LOC121919874 isoform X2 n=1 Tax=Sceloporus undulatus TaxID=8520 RepID=UPI001C4AAD9A|nr:uncharacterized protein LOC121919874 isoform X2 [Sceloporus undulatus]